ncbi:MAG: holo-ACP synthase [Planctomycetes bacterium]|nr:holo-ACP synthase [Planctomycetota bacterium]
MIVGVGVDIAEISRIREGIKKYKRQFLRRIFTADEIRYCIQRKKTPYQHFAARFAAKEAFMKAIGTGWGSKNSPRWKDIEVKKPAHGAPYLILSGRAKKACDRLKTSNVQLSLSHSTNVAVAMVILEK